MMMMLVQSMNSILPSIISSPKQPFFLLKQKPKPLLVRCCAVVAPQQQSTINNSSSSNKPSPGEISRTIMELSSVGTFSTVTKDVDEDDNNWAALGVGVRFAVDPQGTPILSLTPSSYHHHNHKHKQTSTTTLNVQLEQCGGLRTTQCTILGTLQTPQHHHFKNIWEKRFGEKADPDSIHILNVQRVLQIDNFIDDGVWVTCSDYTQAAPDPLRDFAHHLVHEINTHNMEDVLRFCNIYVDSHVQVSAAKMVWVDRLGFDIHLYTPQNDVFEVRIPFPREVTNEKTAKSSFNGMSQLAWEVEKNYHPLQFQKVKHLKKIAARLN